MTLPDFTQSTTPQAVVSTRPGCELLCILTNDVSRTILKMIFLFLFFSADNNTYFCNGCDSKFIEEDSLKDHMAQVHSDKPYKCDYCQAAFRYKGNLASHKTVHTGETFFLLSLLTIKLMSRNVTVDCLLV